MNNKIFDKITRGINIGNFAKKRSFVENALDGISRDGKLGQVWGKVEKMRRFIWNKGVPFYQKVLPLAALLYLVTPIDLVPDFTPIAGYLDDIAVLLWTYSQLSGLLSKQ